MESLSDSSARLIVSLQQIGRALVAARELRPGLEAVLRLISTHFGAAAGSLTILAETGGDVVVVTSSNPSEHELRPDPSPGAAQWVIEHGEPLFLRSRERPFGLSQDSPDLLPSATADSAGASARPRAGAVVYVPVGGAERALAALGLERDIEQPPFTEQDLPVLTVLADYLGIALENDRRTRRLHELMITDDTTGLFNARHLKSMLESEIYRSGRYGYEFSLVFMDLDFFKRVNDRFGHMTGSKVLAEVCRLVKRELRLIDSAFRYGGDEFILMLPQTSGENALVVVRRVQEALNGAGFPDGGGGILHMTASYGVASFPADGTTPQDLLHASDEAMYRVKSASRNGIAMAGHTGLV